LVGRLTSVPPPKAGFHSAYFKIETTNVTIFARRLTVLDHCPTVGRQRRKFEA
jgi:hypothetical protein